MSPHRQPKINLNQLSKTPIRKIFKLMIPHQVKANKIIFKNKIPLKGPRVGLIPNKKEKNMIDLRRNIRKLERKGNNPNRNRKEEKIISIPNLKNMNINLKSLMKKLKRKEKKL